MLHICRAALIAGLLICAAGISTPSWAQSQASSQASSQAFTAAGFPNIGWGYSSPARGEDPYFRYPLGDYSGYYGYSAPSYPMAAAAPAVVPVPMPYPVPTAPSTLMPIVPRSEGLARVILREPTVVTEYPVMVDPVISQPVTYHPGRSLCY